MTPEEMQAFIDGLRPDPTPLREIQEQLTARIAEIRPMTGEQRQEALDLLVQDVADLSENIDVYDRNQAIAFADQLKRIYDLDVATNDPSKYPETARRSEYLDQLKSRVMQGDRRFGIIRNSDRTYVTGLYPTYASATKAFEDNNYNSDTHSVLEHMGEAWESFLATNRPYEEWQKYIKAYNQQILSRLKPLQTFRPDQPSAPTPEVPVVVPLKPTQSRSTVAVGGLGHIPVPMLDPLTGLVSLVAPSQAGPSMRALPDDFKTGDRDRFGRRVTVPATLEGLEKWCTDTYRTHGDAVVAFRSDAGGVVSVTITGDIDSWRQRVELMRIPVALSITEDPADRSITFAYL